MTKTASEIAWEAIKKDVLFSKITVYGLLIDYSGFLAKKSYKLVLDFQGRESNLCVCNAPINAKEAFERLASIIDNAVVTP